jgi:hypothetical protein
MKTLYALVGICMSLHAFAAFADTPALMGDDDSGYIDVRETLAPQRTAPDADVVAVPTIGCPLTVNQNTDDRTAADVVPATIPNPQSAEDRTSSIAGPWAGDTE